MARDMGIEVVAEGVEGIEQFDLLCGLSCQLGQGYLFSKPVDADTATGILRSGLRSAGWQMGQRSLLRGGPDSAAKK
jgi:EAL domain-containing protein (putative c-di-GMP-specific phosphodiesterase class I)